MEKTTWRSYKSANAVRSSRPPPAEKVAVSTGPKHRGQGEGALAVEDARHIGAEHRRQRDDDRAIKQNLNPPIVVMARSLLAQRAIRNAPGFREQRVRTARDAAERR